MASRFSLNVETDIQPISDFRSNTAAVLEQLRQSGRPMVLTQRGRSTAVLLDVHVYQALMEEFETLQDIAQGRSEVAAGRTLSSEEVRQRLQSRRG